MPEPARPLVQMEPFTPASNDELRRMAESLLRREGIDRKRQLFDLLDEAHKFVPPESAIEREFDRLWRQLQDEQRLGGVDPEKADNDEPELKSEYRAIAQRRVRLRLVLKAIARRNDIWLRREEIAAVRGSGYRGPLSAILEVKTVGFIFGLAGVRENDSSDGSRN